MRAIPAARRGLSPQGEAFGAVFSPLLLGMLMDGVGLRPGFVILGILSLAGMLICRAYYKTMEKKAKNETL